MNKGMTGICVLILTAAFLSCQPADVSAGEAGGSAGNIAFLRDGEVWAIDKDGRGIEQVTWTDGKVEEFLFSPASKYLAYSRIIRYVDEPGLWEEGETVPERALCSIVIIRLEGRKVVKEIMPPESSWIHPVKWLPGNRLFFYASSGFDVWGFYEYDIRKGTEVEVGYAEGRRSLDACFHRDGTLVAYTEDSGTGEEFREHLHIADLTSNDDKIVLSGKSIMEPSISRGKGRVAFVEVERVDKEYFDILWILDMESGSLEKLYRGPARAKSGGVSELSWSFDDRYIGMFFSPEALVLEANNPENIHTVRGIDFSWIGNTEFVFAQGDNIYLYSLDAGKRELFLEDASKPFYLWKGTR